VVFGQQKGQAIETACPVEKVNVGLDVRLGLAETLHAVASLPEAAFLEQVNPLEALQYVALNDDATGTLETFMLRHGEREMEVGTC
jgi:hypothetical protein